MVVMGSTGSMKGPDSLKLEISPQFGAIRDGTAVNILEKALKRARHGLLGPNSRDALDCKTLRKKVDRDDCSTLCGDFVESVILH